MNHKLPSIVLIALAVLAIVPARGAIDYSEHLHWVSSVYASGGDVEWQGDYVYAVGSNLSVVDASDPMAPIEIRVVDTPGYAQDVALGDGYAYVADYSSGFQVYVTSNPAWPWIIGNLPASTVGEAVHVGYEDGLAVVGDNQGVLHVVDVTDPAAPLHLGTAALQGIPSGIEIAGDLAYVSIYGYGLQIVDLVPPAEPVVVGSLPIGTNARGLCLAGETVFVAGYSAGLFAVDAADPTYPVVLGSVALGDNAIDVAIDGDLAYVASNWDGFTLVDVADPTEMRVLGNIQTDRNSYGVTFRNGMACLAATGMHFIEVHENVVEPLATLDLGDDVKSVRVAGNRAYATAGSLLQVLDVSAADTPVILGVYDHESILIDILLAGETLFVSTASTVEVVDVTEASAPAHVATIPTVHFPYSIGRYGDVLYVATHAGIEVFDITDPQAAILLSILPWAATHLLVDDDLLYTVASAMAIYDLIDPTIPAQLSSLPVTNAEYISVAGGLAALACDYGGLVLVDVSDPAVPVVLGHAPTSSRTNATAILGDVVYAANGYGGLQIYDASDPATPHSLGTLTLPGVIGELALMDDAIVCAAGVLAFAPLHQADYVGVEDDNEPEPINDGIVPVLRLLDPPAPNPFNPSTTIAFSLEKPQRIRLSVHDLAGRLVRTLIDGTRPFGHGSVIWDGRDEQGRSLPTGSYIVRFATKTVVESRKVTLVE